MALLLLVAMSVALPAHAAPQRIVSTHLCADQWLLQLVEPSRILALSPFAKDPSLSRLADEAHSFPSVRAEAEAIMALKPDLVLLGSFGQHALENRLKRLGVSFLRVADAATIEAMASQAETLGAALGAAPEGEELAQEVRAFAGRYPACTECTPASLVWEGGYASPSTGLHAELAARAGFALSPDVGGHVEMERLLAASLSHIFIARHYRGQARASEWFSHMAWRSLPHSEVHAAALSCAEPGMLAIVPQMQAAAEGR